MCTSRATTIRRGSTAVQVSVAPAYRLFDRLKFFYKPGVSFRPGGPMVDPEGKRLPIKLDSTSNGEFMPVPLSSANRTASRLAHESASGFAKKLSVTRRDFLVSACGACSTLLAFNTANAAAGKTGGYFDLPTESALDLELARLQVGPAKDEFVFDVQG